MEFCPSSEQLRRLLDDALAGPEENLVEAHVNACSRCQAVLEGFMGGAATHEAPGRRTSTESPVEMEERDEFLRRLQAELPAAITLPTRVPVPPKESPVLAASPRSTGEIQVLLRKRLLYSALVTWGTFAAYLIFTAVFAPGASVLAPYVLVLILTGVLIGLLRRTRPVSISTLRWIEVILFGSLAAFFTWLQHYCFAMGWLAAGVERDFSGVLLSARALSLNWVVLVVGYSLLIPNTWRRCAVVVGILAAWPVLLNALLIPPDLPPGQRFVFLVETALNTGLGAALAVYGTHRIETLRRQAVEARKVGPYQLKRLLGTGGMGEVYLAEHNLLRRPCAVKLIRPERAGDPDVLRRFEREVQVMATLSHPNTVEVFDYGHAADGRFYYVMEYLPGLTLEELVRRYGPLSPERAVHLLRQVCGALQEAHGIGLVHRDLKPGNVLVCHRGGLPDIAKLLDFGIVRVSRQKPGVPPLTREGVIAGTPAYMSPEQAAGQADPDGRSDIYSLGAVAYFLLTGRPPFVRATAVQTLAAHLAEDVTPPDRLRRDVPADLQNVVLRCLHKEPAGRFPDVGVVEQALAGCACAGLWTRERAAGWWREHPVEAPTRDDSVP